MGTITGLLPKGARFVVLSGDLSKDGPYAVRLKMPAGYKIPAHNHPTTEMVAVISGNLHLGMGDKLDKKKGASLTAGGYAEAPGKYAAKDRLPLPTSTQRMTRETNPRPRIACHWVRRSC
jgi:hypothetical protein